MANGSYTTTAAMREEADTGLKWRQMHGRGGTGIGVARARDISNGRNLPLDTVKRMHSYFSRHAVDMDAPANSNTSDPGYPGAGLIAWKLWGGNPGRAWAEDIMSQQESAASNDVVELGESAIDSASDNVQFGVLDGRKTGLPEIIKWIDSVKGGRRTELGMPVEEFFNRCHDPKTGKFCAASTPGARPVGSFRAARILRLAKKESGATLKLDTLESVKSGYCVGVRPKNAGMFPGTTGGKQQIEKWLQDNEAELSKPGNHIGVWYDKKVGTLWLDITRVYPNTNAGGQLAMRAAGRHRQIAIFHLDTMTEIEHPKADQFRREAAAAA